MIRELAGRYRLLDRLGAGGMSEVWRAHDTVLDREVAVKVLDTDHTDVDLAQRIRVEARSAARLHHPNVVEVHDFGETEDGVPYVVMELLQGHSLAAVLRDGALPWQSAATICAQVAAALAAAHARGIVHRDVKPSNVMVTADGVKLVDFGISATVGEADGEGGEVFGTPAYLAPERLRGGVVRPATDVYALGLLLYLCLAGRLPWTASTTTQMLSAHRYLEPEALPPVLGLPFDVADLCRRCTAKDPAHRPHAAEAARVLSAAAGVPGSPSLLDALDAPTAPLALTFAGVRRSRRRPFVAAAALAIALTGAGVAWFGTRPGPDGVAALSEAPAAAAPAPALKCAVGYAIRSATGGRLSTAVTITNTGTVPADRWELAFALPAGQKLVRGWQSGWAQSGDTLQVRGSGLAAGERVSTGFDASYPGTTTLPAEFLLNGTVCQAQLSVAGRSVPPTTAAVTTRPGGKAGPAGRAAGAVAPAAKPAKAGKPAKSTKDNSGKGSSGSGKGKGGKN
jgi:hypothetical protein